MNKIVIFTGGGTAGHVYPGLSVAEALMKKDGGIKIVWLGSGKGMEADIVRQSGIDFIGIPSGKLRRYFSVKNFFDLFKIAAGLVKAFFVIKKMKPDLVFSKGGFVSVPPVTAAGLLKIPVISHESDLTPGLATRINSRFSEKILVSYERSLDYFPGGRAVVTGNPVRSAIYRADAARGRKLAGGGDKKIIFVIGGSQGALQINLLIEELIEDLVKDFTVIHQMGAYSFKTSNLHGYITRDFIKEELPDFIAASDLIVSRAGASTLWETASLGKASILIPLGSGSSRGDQIKNAEVFKEAGASIVLSGDLKAERLKNEIYRLMSDETLRNKMGQDALDFVRGNPSDKISDIIKERLS
ncbi:MAG: undecaprenyldiphospho-muramoylpentapeptide beta-N-acetylglucosaminyltransferase [Spirochaetales bacterium]|nr:undecaprenyldiphospho-muramoylpentapeptide beta-N-acetylglucosaminyltransferase [Spirochaetales bacterium]